MIAALYFGPAFASGAPRQIVIHSAETDIVPGLAVSLAKGWFRNPNNKTSAHAMTDPAGVVEMVPETQQAWHCGNGNSTSLGDEHTGRAAFTTAQWTTPAGLAMLRASAKEVAGQCTRHGIRARWLSLTQLAANEDGLCTHNDMRLVRGGTTHTDPGPGFPYAAFLSMVRAVLAPTPAPPAPTPTPPPVQEDDMGFTEAQLRAIIRSEVIDVLKTEQVVTYQDYRLRPMTTSLLSIVDALSRDSGYDSNASGGVDNLERLAGTNPEARKVNLGKP